MRKKAEVVGVLYFRVWDLEESAGKEDSISTLEFAFNRLDV
jgi:hypothetical protein